MSQCCRSMDHLVIGPTSLRCRSRHSQIRHQVCVWPVRPFAWCFRLSRKLFVFWGRPNSFPSFFACLIASWYILIYLDCMRFQLKPVQFLDAACNICNPRWNPEPPDATSHLARSRKMIPTRRAKRLTTTGKRVKRPGNFHAAAQNRCTRGTPRTRDLDGPRSCLKGFERWDAVSLVPCPGDLAGSQSTLGSFVQFRQGQHSRQSHSGKAQGTHWAEPPSQDLVFKCVHTFSVLFSAFVHNLTIWQAITPYMEREDFDPAAIKKVQFWVILLGVE